MTSLLFKFLIIYVPIIVAEQLGYISNIWWIFIVIPSAEYLIRVWNNWRRTNSKITPEQSLAGLTALLRIRSAEIGAIYHQVRSYQKKAKKNAWIPLFMADYREQQFYNLYEISCDNKYLKKTLPLYTKRFSYNYLFGTFEERVLMDTSAAIQHYCFGFDRAVRLLNSIQCDANLSRHVCALLREYRIIQLLSLNGNYHILFKGWWPLGNLVRESYCRLRNHWEEIARSHQGIILITKASDIIKKDTSTLDNLMAENEALCQMEWNLNRAMSQENSESLGWEFDCKKEASFFEHLKVNPIWTKFYNCDLEAPVSDE